MTACVACVVLVLMHDAPVANLLLIELIKVKTHYLSLFADTEMQEGNEFQSIEKDAGYDEGVGSNSADLGQLISDLDAVAIHGTEGVVGSHAVEIVDPRLREETGEERTDHAANAVQLEDVQTLIDLDPLIDVVAQSANSARKKSNEGSKPNRDIASCGSNTNETGNGT